MQWESVERLWCEGGNGMTTENYLGWTLAATCLVGG